MRRPRSGSACKAMGAIARASAPGAFDAFIRSEVEKLGEVAAAAGARVD